MSPRLIPCSSPDKYNGKPNCGHRGDVTDGTILRPAWKGGFLSMLVPMLVDEVCLGGLPASAWCTWIELANLTTYLMMSRCLILCSSLINIMTKTIMVIRVTSLSPRGKVLFCQCWPNAGWWSLPRGTPASAWCTWIELADSTTYLMISPSLILCSSLMNITTNPIVAIRVTSLSPAWKGAFLSMLAPVNVCAFLTAKPRADMPKNVDFDRSWSMSLFGGLSDFIVV